MRVSVVCLSHPLFSVLTLTKEQRVHNLVLKSETWMSLVISAEHFPLQYFARVWGLRVSLCFFFEWNFSLILSTRTRTGNRDKGWVAILWKLSPLCHFNSISILLFLRVSLSLCSEQYFHRNANLPVFASLDDPNPWFPSVSRTFLDWSKRGKLINSRKLTILR